jgi:hypothetical protein
MVPQHPLGVPLCERVSMPYIIDIPPVVATLLEELPRRSCAVIYSTLERIAEVAPVWPLDDLRWERLVQRDKEGLHFYVDGCCVRIYLHPTAHRLQVREIGRIIVYLPVGLSIGQNLVGSPVEQ